MQGARRGVPNGHNDLQDPRQCSNTAPQRIQNRPEVVANLVPAGAHHERDGSGSVHRANHAAGGLLPALRARRRVRPGPSGTRPSTARGRLARRAPARRRHRHGVFAFRHSLRGPGRGSRSARAVQGGLIPGRDSGPPGSIPIATRPLPLLRPARLLCWSKATGIVHCFIALAGIPLLPIA
ncbi:hypothetical protein VARIO8X_90114 [Burkholderiales bacterium 8X]|nr:hypothetical protein VARIO8X_90114 [Burkholderiales bacterium 8X]